MVNIEIDAFQADMLKLTRSIIIKMDFLGVIDNQLLLRSGYDVSPDRRTWRYYLNLNGEYHPTDDPMMITSLDTKQEIVFNKENLRTHLATKRGYAVGEYYYKRLLEAYPHQEDLIKGIISPIPLEESIESKDFKILRYDESRVEWNEDQLIPELQKWVDAQVFAHNRSEYNYTEDLMPALLLGKLYGFMTNAIDAIRIEAIGTRHAHSFHVWSKLNSFGVSSDYRRALNNYQTMYLYRNIEWLNKNVGQQYTFDKLLQNLLTVRRIPLANFTLGHNTETQPDDLTPTPQFIRSNLNLTASYGVRKEIVTPEVLINKEIPTAKDNAEVAEEYLADVVEKATISLHTQVPTKVLESTMEDYTARHADTLMTVLRSEWVYLAGNNLYKAVVDFTDPRSGKRFKITPKEASVLWEYLLLRYRGKDYEDVQPSYYHRAMKLQYPSVNEMLSYGQNEYLSRKLVEDVLELGIDFSTMISAESFYNQCVDVYRRMWDFKKVYSQFDGTYQHAQVRHAVNQMYVSGYMFLTDHKTYDEFLLSIDLDVRDYQADELLTLAWTIYQTATGWNAAEHVSLRETQTKLINLMAQLSSYTIQFVSSIDDGIGVIENQHRMSLGYNDDTRSVLDSSGVGLRLGHKLIPDFGLQADLALRTSNPDERNIEARMEINAKLPIGNNNRSVKRLSTRPGNTVAKLPMGMRLKNNLVTEMLYLKDVIRDRNLNGLYYPDPPLEPIMLPLKDVIIERNLDGLIYPDMSEFIPNK